MHRLLFFIPILILAQKTVQHEGMASIELDNGKVRLVVTNPGGSFASFSLSSGNRLNPIWDPARMSREAGGRARTNTSTGHFLCVDGFGPVSADEQRAGYPGHGEASRLPWEVLESTPASIGFRLRLPIVQEVLRRKVTLAPGEQIDIEPGGWLYKDPTVRMDTIFQKLSTGFFASAGQLFWNRFTGPGRVGLQSMYYHPPTASSS